MSTLELECPGCDQLLELDAGFAGGVCRCSNCGTLMTVPAETGQAVEAVKQRSARPDRPDTPTHRDRPTRPDTPAATSARTPEQPAATTAAPGEQVYTTASGREVHVDEATAIPTAQKKTRLVVRTVTAMIFAGLLGVVLVLAGMGVWLLSSAQQEAAVRPVLETFDYDPRLNPYQQPLANVLGMPLAEQAVVVVDAAEVSERWLSEMNHALHEGLSNTRSRSAVALVYANDEGLHVHPGRPRPLARWREGDLSRFQANITASGEGPLAAAFNRAMQWTPEQVVLVVGREPGTRELSAMREALAADVTLDVVTIDGDSAALDDLTAEFEGRYTALTRDQLEQWRSAGESTSNTTE